LAGASSDFVEIKGLLCGEGPWHGGRHSNLPSSILPEMPPKFEGMVKRSLRGDIRNQDTNGWPHIT
jgi:hypothetical protein